MQTLTDYFKGLSDPNRLRILNLLLHGELCGCDIQYILRTSQPNVSRHLTYLKNCGLVSDRRDGFRVFYSLADRRQGALAPLFEFLGKAFKNEETLRRDARKLKHAITTGSCTVSEWRAYPAFPRARSTAASGARARA